MKSSMSVSDPFIVYLRIALALDGPEIPFHRLCHKVNARILAAKVFLVGELPPKPDMTERALMPRHGLQERLHQTFKTVALVAFGKDMARYLARI